MINYFAEQTAPLTEDEENLIPGFISSLKNHVGRESAITSHQIIKKFNEIGIKITGARIRKIIHHIRVNDLVSCVMGTSKGYYISNDLQEFKDYIESLKQRSNAIDRVRSALIEQAKTRFNPGQINLNLN